jgi:hypothetical protein
MAAATYEEAMSRRRSFSLNGRLEGVSKMQRVTVSAVPNLPHPE